MITTNTDYATTKSMVRVKVIVTMIPTLPKPFHPSSFCGSIRVTSALAQPDQLPPGAFIIISDGVVSLGKSSEQQQGEK